MDRVKIGMLSVLLFFGLLISGAFAEQPILFNGVNPSFSSCVIEGDSLSAGYEGLSWTQTINNYSGFENCELTNFALNGDTVHNMVSEYETQAHATPTKDLFILYAGTNDLRQNTDAQTIFNDLKTIWTAAHNDGFKVLAFTLQPQADATAQQETERIALNDLVVTNNQYYDYLVHPDLTFSTVSATYYDPNTLPPLVHYNSVGYDKLAEEIQKATQVNGIAAGFYTTQTVLDTNYFIGVDDWNYFAYNGKVGLNLVFLSKGKDSNVNIYMEMKNPEKKFIVNQVTFQGNKIIYNQSFFSTQTLASNVRLPADTYQTMSLQISLSSVILNNEEFDIVIKDLEGNELARLDPYLSGYEEAHSINIVGTHGAISTNNTLILTDVNTSGWACNGDNNKLAVGFNQGETTTSLDRNIIGTCGGVLTVHIKSPLNIAQNTDYNAVDSNGLYFYATANTVASPKTDLSNVYNFFDDFTDTNLSASPTWSVISGTWSVSATQSFSPPFGLTTGDSGAQILASTSSSSANDVNYSTYFYASTKNASTNMMLNLDSNVEGIGNGIWINLTIANDGFHCYTSGAGGSDTGMGGSPTQGTWYKAVIEYKEGNNKANCYILDTSGAIIVSSINQTITPFTPRYVGFYNDNSGTNPFYDNVYSIIPVNPAPSFVYGTPAATVLQYRIDFNVFKSETSTNLTNINLDCNVNAYDLSGQNSPFSQDFNSGIYSCIFSKAGYDSNTQIINVDSNKSLNVYLNEQGFVFSDLSLFKVGTTTILDLNFLGNLNAVFYFLVKGFSDTNINENSMKVYYTVNDGVDTNCFGRIRNTEFCGWKNDNFTFTVSPTDANTKSFTSFSEDDHLFKSWAYNLDPELFGTSEKQGFKLTTTNNWVKVRHDLVPKDKNMFYNFSFDANFTGASNRTLRIFDCNSEIPNQDVPLISNTNCAVTSILPTYPIDADNYRSIKTITNDNNQIVIDKNVNVNPDGNHWIYFNCVNCNVGNYWTIRNILGNSNVDTNRNMTKTGTSAFVLDSTNSFDTHYHWVKGNATTTFHFYVDGNNYVKTEESYLYSDVLNQTNLPPLIGVFISPTFTYYKGTMDINLTVSDDNISTIVCDFNLLDVNKANVTSIATDVSGSSGTCKTTLNTTLYTDGNYFIHGTVREVGTQDLFSVSADSGANFGIDNTAPSVGITTVSGFSINGSEIWGTGNIIGGTASDSGIGINNTTCEYTDNNGASWGTATWNTDHCEKTGITIIDTNTYVFNTRIQDALNSIGTGLTTIEYTGTEPAPITYKITFDINFQTTELTDVNIDCNVNTYDLMGQNSPVTSDINAGTYSCTFARTGFDSNTIEFTADANKTIPIYLSDSTSPTVGTTTINGFSIYSTFIKGTGNIIGGTATDNGSGINTTTCEYTTNNGVDWNAGAWDTNHCTGTSTTLTNGTTYTFNTRVQDLNGNIGTGTATSTHIGDTVAPIITDNISATTYRTLAIITLDSNDGIGSGVLFTKYRLDTDNTTTTNFGAWTDYTTPIYLPEDGNFTIQYYSGDNLDNNTSTIQKDIIIAYHFTATFNILDTNGGTPLTNISADWNINAYDVTGQNSPFQQDINYGIYSINFSKTGYDSNTQIINVDSNTTNTIYLNLILPPSVGTTTITGFTTNATEIWGTGNIVGGTVTDNGGGIDTTTCEYTTDGNTWNTATWDTNHCTKTGITITKNTTYTFNTRIRDLLSNIGTGTPTSSYIADNTHPTYSSIDNNDTWIKTDFNISIKGLDFNIAGKNIAKYKINSSAWTDFGADYNILINTDGNHTIRLWFNDNAGNDLNLTVYALRAQTPPRSTSITPTSNVSTTNTTYTFEFDFNSPSGLARCRTQFLNADTNATIYDENITPTSISGIDYRCVRVYTALPLGSYKATSIAFDFADNNSSTVTSGTVQIVAPQISNPTQNNPSGGGSGNDINNTPTQPPAITNQNTVTSKLVQITYPTNNTIKVVGDERKTFEIKIKNLTDKNLLLAVYIDPKSYGTVVLRQPVNSILVGETKTLLFDVQKINTFTKMDSIITLSINTATEQYEHTMHIEYSENALQSFFGLITNQGTSEGTTINGVDFSANLSFGALLIIVVVIVVVGYAIKRKKG